jgi:hypothetical protein
MAAFRTSSTEASGAVNVPFASQAEHYAALAVASVSVPCAATLSGISQLSQRLIDASSR